MPTAGRAQFPKTAGDVPLLPCEDAAQALWWEQQPGQSKPPRGAWGPLSPLKRRCQPICSCPAWVGFTFLFPECPVSITRVWALLCSLFPLALSQLSALGAAQPEWHRAALRWAVHRLHQAGDTITAPGGRGAGMQYAHFPFCLLVFSL